MVKSVKVNDFQGISRFVRSYKFGKIEIKCVSTVITTWWGSARKRSVCLVRFDNHGLSRSWCNYPPIMVDPDYYIIIGDECEVL